MNLSEEPSTLPVSAAPSQILRSTWLGYLVLSHFSLVWLCVTLQTVSPPGSSIHGMLQARILEWVVMLSFRGSSLPRDWTHVSSVPCIGRRVLYHYPPGYLVSDFRNILQVIWICMQDWGALLTCVTWPENFLGSWESQCRVVSGWGWMGPSKRTLFWRKENYISYLKSEKCLWHWVHPSSRVWSYLGLPPVSCRIHDITYKLEVRLFFSFF